MSGAIGSAGEHRGTWFGPSTRPLAGWWHVPEDGQARGAVVLAPPFAREHISAHRTLRMLARALVQSGFAVLRMDYDGTGDSAGNFDDPNRVAAWKASIAAATAETRSAGAREVGIVAMRLAAPIAAAAAPGSGDLSGLVLWDPPDSPRMWLRQLNALLHMSVRTAGRQDGAGETPGYVFPAACVEDLHALTWDAIPRPHVCTLIVGRSDREAPRTLRPWLDDPHVTWITAPGQEELLEVESSAAAVPEQGVKTIVDWLDATLGTATTAIAPTIRTRAVVSHLDDGTPVEEEHVRMGPAGLYGIVTEIQPAAGRTLGPTYLLVNSANEHHVGPARQWVELARGWAHLSARSVRFDLSGLGDSPARPGRREHVVYAPEAIDDAIDASSAAAPGNGKDVVFLGQCSGAYTSIEAGLLLEPTGVISINLLPWVDPVDEETGTVDPRRMAVRGGSRTIRRLVDKDWIKSWKESAPEWFWAFLDKTGIRHSPSRAFTMLVDKGVQTFVLAGDVDAELYLSRSAKHLRTMERSGRFQFTVVKDLHHSLYGAAEREIAAALLTDWVRRMQESRGHGSDGSIPRMAG